MKGGRSWYQEDPRRRINFTLGLHAEILVRVVHKYRMFEKELQSTQVKRTPQDSTYEFSIRKLNPLLVVDFRFIPAFLHA